uniref:Response regulatory domain-containing protein n=1 Tax=Arundo donax TaxID=35708 RepID=A0A0A9DAW4_ARUDO
MCAYDDEEAVTECMALGACFHVLKPLNTGSFNIMKQKALQYKSRSATTHEGPSNLNRTKSRTVSSSTKKPKNFFVLDKNDLCNPKSEEYEEPVVRKALGCSKKAARFKWTVELHEKFLVVEALGDKCEEISTCGLELN